MTRYINDWYGTTVVDVDEHLVKTHGGDIDELYSDTAHYTRPEGVDIVGRLVAGTLANRLAHHEPLQGLPPPIGRAHLAFAHYTTDLAPLAAGNAEAVTYSNSHATIDTTRIGAGQSFRFRLKGSIVALAYVSTQTSGLIELTCGDEVHVLPTMWYGMTSGTYKFLIGHIVPELHFGFRIVDHDRYDISLRVLGADDPAIDDAGRAKQTLYLHPVDGSAPTFSLAGILHTGWLAPL